MIATGLRAVSREWLEGEGACEDQIELFAATFGASAELTRENAIKAARAGLDIDWLADRLLAPPAWRAYEEATAPALRACHEAKATARRAYEEATAPALRACHEATASARRTCHEARATALRAYQEAMATALCDALNLLG